MLLSIVVLFDSCKKDPPFANIQYSGQLFVGEDIEFKSTNFEANTYDWSFGDGNTLHSVNNNPNSHTYTTAGTYTVQLTVTDDGGSYTTSVTVTIKPLPTSVKIKKIHLVYCNLSGWDPGSQTGPDIFYNINELTTFVSNGSVVNDVTYSSLPVVWTYNSPFLSLQYSGSLYNIAFYDSDGTSSEFMFQKNIYFKDGMPFTSNFIEYDYPNLIAPEYRIKLEVEYVY